MITSTIKQKVKGKYISMNAVRMLLIHMMKHPPDYEPFDIDTPVEMIQA
jgi:hypothetical protein